MRLLLTGSILVALCAAALGQTAPPVKLNLPVVPPPPRPLVLNEPTASTPELTAPALELRFPHWRELAIQNAAPAQGKPMFHLSPKLMASLNATPGQCSIPLIEIPLPEHFDDGMVRKMGPHPDDKMVMASPPVCPLRSERVNPLKRK